MAAKPEAKRVDDDLLNIPGFLKRKDGGGSTFERVTAPPPRQSAAAGVAPKPAIPSPPTTPPAATREGFAAWIAEPYAAMIEGSLEVGRRLLCAKETLKHGEFQAMVDADLPFKRRMAEMFMAVARDTRILNAQRVALLPDSLVARYALTRLDDAVLDDAYAGGKVTPAMTRAEAVKLKREAEAAKVQAENAARAAEQPDGETLAGDVRAGLEKLIAAGRTFRVLYVDPPWKYETFSDKGNDRAPPYPTMTLAALAALPVDKVAAKDALIFMWTVRWAATPALVECLALGGAYLGGETMVPMFPLLMKAWGFDLVTRGFVWAKRNPQGGGAAADVAEDETPPEHRGTGHYTRANPEDCWIGKRGSPRILSHSVDELIVAPVGLHSEKPREAYDRIMRIAAGEYLELFARDRYPGWTAIGNQLGRAKGT